MMGREVWDLIFLSSCGVFGGFLPARDWIWVVTAFTFQPFSCQSPLPSITDTFWKTASPGHFQQRYTCLGLCQGLQGRELALLCAHLPLTLDPRQAPAEPSCRKFTLDRFVLVLFPPSSLNYL